MSCENCQEDTTNATPCDWCVHMNLIDKSCDNCNPVIYIFNQNICGDCLYNAIIDSDVTFCYTCDDFIYIPDHIDSHQIEDDSSIVIAIAISTRLIESLYRYISFNLPELIY